MITASFVIFEAAISVLNLGVPYRPQAEAPVSTNWGTLLVFDPNSASGTFFVEESNWVAFWPLPRCSSAWARSRCLRRGCVKQSIREGGS